MACGGPAHNCCPLYPVCILTASEALFFWLVSLSLSVFVSFLSVSPFFMSLNVLQQLAAPRPIQLVCVMLLFPHSLMFTLQMSQTVSSEALDVVFWPRRLTTTLKTAARAVLTVCLLISLCTLQCVSLFWLGVVLRPALLCTVYDSLPLVACSKIQTNRWCWIIHPSESLS